MIFRASTTALVLVCVLGAGFAAPDTDGTLQLHYLDVGQGDAALIITPDGTVVAFDAGPAGAACDATIDYYGSLGITEIDYFVTSHYHADHVGCAPELLARFPVTGEVIDRGGNYGTQTYKRYRKAVKKDRKKARVGREIVLQAQASRFADPIILTLVAANGKSTAGQTSVSKSDENSRGLVALVSMGDFSALFGGDIAGTDTGSYSDVESVVGPAVGQVEIYKVHHHGSKFSTSAPFLTQIDPVVAVVSSSTTNSFGHPTADAMGRLHDARVPSFWTTAGNGVKAVNKWDQVCTGPVVASAAPGDDSFSVTCRNKTRNYDVEVAVPLVAPGPPLSLSANVNGSSVTLRWSAPTTGGAVDDYLVQVGTSTGASNYGTATTTARTLQFTSVPNGTYYARVRARNSGGSGNPTTDRMFVINVDDGGGVPNMSMTITMTSTPEVATIRNNSGGAVDMTGWKLVSVVGPQTFNFPNGYTVPAGGQLRVTSGSNAFSGGDALKWSGAFIWNNGGDEGKLLDDQGRLVARVVGP
jgi:beta-lactamase superfamily II metal-dependent hydrolase